MTARFIFKHNCGWLKVGAAAVCRQIDSVAALIQSSILSLHRIKLSFNTHIWIYGCLSNLTSKGFQEILHFLATWECWAGSRVWRWALPCWSDLNWGGCSGSDHCDGLFPLERCNNTDGKTSHHWPIICDAPPAEISSSLTSVLPERKASFFLSTGRIVLASMLTFDICRCKRKETF